MRGIRFEVADLAAPGLARRLGGTFDLITCHGVLSYVPRPGRVLRTFARCLHPRGALYLGVNGAAHQSGRLRRALPALGLDLDDFRDNARTRAVLGLCDAVLSGEGYPRISGLGPAYVASDVFGTPNHLFSLPGWVGLARAAGLRFRAASASVRQFRRLAEEGRTGLLLPRSRAELATLFELLVPARFHRLVFTRAPEANPPWKDRRRLYGWTIERSRLYRVRLPRPGPAVRDRLRSVTISSRPFDTLTAWRMPEWELALLRSAPSGRSIGSLLDGLPLAVPFADVRDQLFILHHLGIVTVRPPPGPGAAARPHPR
jgi:SAM-dependent methyltransferase